MAADQEHHQRRGHYQRQPFRQILEVLPVNIYLKSPADRKNIITSFAAYLKIAPDSMQFEARTLPADMTDYIRQMEEYAKNEENDYCR